jgi:zinc/manganese transport system substrate-binding protein
MKRRHLIAAAAAPALLAAWSLPTLATPAAAEPLRVVASFSILADWLREIGGDAVRVETLVGPDADAHVFNPRPSDARKLAGADLVAVIGLGFEGWLPRLIKASGSRAPVVEASQGIKPLKGGQGHGHGHDVDPHFWHDPLRVIQALHTLRDALSRARPPEAEGFARRCAAYEAQLMALHAQVQTWLAHTPVTERRVLTHHDAFAYFGKAYSVQFLAIKGMNTEAEATAGSVGRLIQRLRRERVRAVFVENISDPRLVQRIAAEAGATVGGRLYSDALSAPGGEADTYLKLLAHNASAMATALQRKPS